jgi:hypothetical protein
VPGVVSTAPTINEARSISHIRILIRALKNRLAYWLAICVIEEASDFLAAGLHHAWLHQRIQMHLSKTQ